MEWADRRQVKMCIGGRGDGDRGLTGAVRAADRAGASLALVAGDRDIEAGTIGVKNLSNGEQADIAADAVVAELLSRLT